MKFIVRMFDKLVDMMDRYNRYKATCMLYPYVKDRKELETLINDLYK